MFSHREYFISWCSNMLPRIEVSLTLLCNSLEFFFSLGKALFMTVVSDIWWLVSFLQILDLWLQTCLEAYFRCLVFLKLMGLQKQWLLMWCEHYRSKSRLSSFLQLIFSERFHRSNTTAEGNPAKFWAPYAVETLILHRCKDTASVLLMTRASMIGVWYSFL